MNILLFGASGMVGDGVLRWLIASPKVSRPVAVSRKPLPVQHPKLHRDYSKPLNERNRLFT